MTSEDEFEIRTMAMDEIVRTLGYQERRLQNLRTRGAFVLTTATAATAFLTAQSIGALAQTGWIVFGLIYWAFLMLVGAWPQVAIHEFCFAGDPDWYVTQAREGRDRLSVMDKAIAYWNSKIEMNDTQAAAITANRMKSRDIFSVPVA